MIAQTLTLDCTGGAAQNGQPHPLLLHANIPMPPICSGIVWHHWGQGSVLILLHDWNQTWQHNIEPSSRKLQVYVAQLSGAPGKPSPDCNDMQFLAQALRSDLKQLFPVNTLSLLGQGWGSMLATYMAPDMEQLSILVLQDVGGHGCAPHLAAPQLDWPTAKLQCH